MRIQFQTNDPMDAIRLRGETLPNGLAIEFPPPPAIKSFPFEEVTTFFLIVTGTVAANLISSWLLEKLKDSSSETITIEHKEVNFEQGQVSRTIDEIIRIEKK